LLTCLTAPSAACVLTPALHDALPIYRACDVLPQLTAASPPRLASRGVRLRDVDSAGHAATSCVWSGGSTAIGSALASPARNHASDRKSTRLNSSHVNSSYAVFCWR